MTPEIKALLVELRERVESEDYIGTCGCVRKPPKGQTREEYCSCLKEHNALLAKIDAAVRGRSGTGTIYFNPRMKP